MSVTGQECLVCETRVNFLLQNIGNMIVRICPNCGNISAQIQKQKMIRNDTN